MQHPSSIVSTALLRQLTDGITPGGGIPVRHGGPELRHRNERTARFFARYKNSCRMTIAGERTCLFFMYRLWDRKWRPARLKSHDNGVRSDRASLPAPLLQHLSPGRSLCRRRKCRLFAHISRTTQKGHAVVAWPFCSDIIAGDHLISHTVTRAVPSAQRGLTSVFEMGTGDPSQYGHRQT